VTARQLSDWLETCFKLETCFELARDAQDADGAVQQMMEGLRDMIGDAGGAGPHGSARDAAVQALLSALSTDMTRGRNSKSQLKPPFFFHYLGLGTDLSESLPGDARNSQNSVP